MIRPVGIGSPLVEVRVVTDPFQVGDAEVEKLRPLKKHLAKLDLRHTGTDRAMADIATFSKLTELNLRGTKVGRFRTFGAFFGCLSCNLSTSAKLRFRERFGGSEEIQVLTPGFLVGQSGEPGRTASDSEDPRSQIVLAT